MSLLRGTTSDAATARSFTWPALPCVLEKLSYTLEIWTWRKRLFSVSQMLRPLSLGLSFGQHCPTHSRNCLTSSGRDRVKAAILRLLEAVAATARSIPWPALPCALEKMSRKLGTWLCESDCSPSQKSSCRRRHSFFATEIALCFRETLLQTRNGVERM